MTLSRWVERPLRVAAALNAGEAGGSYYEATMLVATVISGVSAYVWPGERIDRARFVEAWVSFAGLSTARVSLPLLIATLHREQRHDEANCLKQLRREMFGAGYDVRILTGDEVDAEEDELLSACPSLDVRLLRTHSYPAVFYRHVRSRLVHEYRLEGAATQMPMTTREAPVSYANHLVAPMNGGKAERRDVERRIHFHMPWTSETARLIARVADDRAPEGDAPRPNAWWVDGCVT